MTSCRANDLKNFKKGAIFPYFVKYLGRGPVNDEVPDFVLERKNPIPGKLIFSLDKITFFCEEDVYNDPFGDFTHNSSIEESFSEESVNFNYLINQIESENMCYENKILCITLIPGVTNNEKQNIYFDVFDLNNKRCCVYYPQWFEIAKIHNETRPGNERSNFAQDIIDSCVIM